MTAAVRHEPMNHDLAVRAATGHSRGELVHVAAAEPAVQARVTLLLRRAGISISSLPGPDVLVVAVGRTVEEALDACTVEPVSIVVSASFSVVGVRRAVRAGATVLLELDRTTPEGLSAAVHAARGGEGRLPHEALVRLLGGDRQPSPRPMCTPLTPRQTEVLSLTAEGHGNAAIAESLSCSEHTVKNVIYDLMARLQVRNRAHAVAQAVRTGLI